MRLRPNTSPADPALLAAMEVARAEVMEAMEGAKEFMERVCEAHPQIEPGDIIEMSNGFQLLYKTPDQCEDEQEPLGYSIGHLMKHMREAETLENQRAALLGTLQSACHMTLVGRHRPEDFEGFCKYLQSAEEKFMAQASFSQKNQCASLFKDAADYAALCKDARHMIVGLKAKEIDGSDGYVREPTPYNMACREFARHYPERAANGQATPQDMEWIRSRAVSNLKEVMQPFEEVLPEPIYPEMMGIALHIGMAEHKKNSSRKPEDSVPANDNVWIANPRVHEVISKKLRRLFDDYRPAAGRELVELLEASRGMDRVLTGGQSVS